MKKTESETDTTQAQETLNDLMHTKDTVNARLLRDTKCIADLTSQFSSVDDELRDAVEHTLKDIRTEFDKRKKRVAPGIKRLEDTLKSLNKSEAVLKNKDRQYRNADLKRAKRRMKDAELSLLECSIIDHDTALYTIAVGHIMSLNQTLMQIPINWKLYNDTLNSKQTPTPRLGDSEDYDSDDLTPRRSPHVSRKGHLKSPKPKSRSGDRVTKRSPRRSIELKTTKLSIPKRKTESYAAGNDFPSDKKQSSLEAVDFFSSDPDTNDEGFHTSEMASNTSQYQEDIDFVSFPEHQSSEGDEVLNDRETQSLSGQDGHGQMDILTTSDRLFANKGAVKHKRSKSTPPYTRVIHDADILHNRSLTRLLDTGNQWISSETLPGSTDSNEQRDSQMESDLISAEQANRKERNVVHERHGRTRDTGTSHASSKSNQRRFLPSLPGQLSNTAVPISDREAADGLYSLAQLATTATCRPSESSNRSYRSNRVPIGDMEYIDFDADDLSFNETVKTARREIIERLKSRYAITTGQRVADGYETHTHTMAKLPHGKHSRRSRVVRKDGTPKLLKRDNVHAPNELSSPLRKYKSTPALFEEFEKASRTKNAVKTESNARSRSPTKRLQHTSVKSKLNESTTMQQNMGYVNENSLTSFTSKEISAKRTATKHTLQKEEIGNDSNARSNVNNTKGEHESLVEKNINRFEEAAIKHFNGNAMNDARSQRHLLNMRSRSLSTTRRPMMAANSTQPGPKALRPRNPLVSSKREENESSGLHLHLKYDTEIELDNICSGHSARTIRRQWQHRRSSSMNPSLTAATTTPVERISKPMFKKQTTFVLPELAKNSVCCISGMACLHNELIVLLDENNKHLHLIDEELLHRHLYSETDVAISICAMETNSFAVAIPYRFCVRLYTTSNCKISVKRDVEIKCSEWVMSVCHENQLLYVMCKGGHIHITDYRGREQRHVNTGMIGRLTVGPSGRRFYVSGEGRLTRINADGAVMWSRTDITSDTTLLHKDTLYVADKKRKILVSLAEFSGIRDLFREEVKNPSAVCMSQNEHVLYIGQYANGMDSLSTRTISVFTLNKK